MEKGAIEDALATTTATDSGFVLARRAPLKSRPYGFLPAFWRKTAQWKFRPLHIPFNN
jgi:hypothetical protein